MSTPLIPCTGCARHVRASESSCPFCGATLEARAIETTSEPARFTGRSQVMAFRARAGAVAIATATAVSGCYASGPLYGAPPVDSGSDRADAGTPADAAVEVDGGPVPMYGAPPDAGGSVDSGIDAASVALYGGPPSPGGGSNG